MPDCELVLRCVKLDSSENFEGLHGEFCRMRKTSASVHCSGALSHGAPAAKATAAANKNRHTTRRVNMARTHPDSIRTGCAHAANSCCERLCCCSCDYFGI